MAKTTVPQTAITANQVDCVLNDIAITANVIKRFSVMLVHEEDERDVDALTQGIQRLAERIGFLSDMTTYNRQGGIGPVFGETPEEWMMPPSYHETAPGAVGA